MTSEEHLSRVKESLQYAMQTTYGKLVQLDFSDNPAAKEVMKALFDNQLDTYEMCLDPDNVIDASDLKWWNFLRSEIEKG